MSTNTRWIKCRAVFASHYGSWNYLSVSSNLDDAEILSEIKEYIQTDPEGFRSPEYEFIEYPPIEWVDSQIILFENRIESYQQALKNYIEFKKSIPIKERPYETKLIHEWCEPIEISNFIKRCSKRNSFYNDKNGVGYLATEEIVSDIKVSPDKLDELKEVTEKYPELTHVAWYNK